MKKILKQTTACMLICMLVFVSTSCSARPDMSVSESSVSSSRPPPTSFSEPDISESSEDEQSEVESVASESSALESSVAVSSVAESSSQPEESVSVPDEESSKEEDNTPVTPASYAQSKVAAVYAHNPTDFTYAPLSQSAAQQVVDLLQKALDGKPEEIYSQNQGGLMVMLNDEERTRFNYTLVPTAVRVGDDAYPTSDDNYSALKSFADAANASGPNHAQWLVFMDPARITAVYYYPGETTSPLVVSPDSLAIVGRMLAKLQMQRGSGNTFEKDARSFNIAPGRTVITVGFNTGVSYMIGIENGNIYIQSSDMNYGCEYRLLNSLSDIHAILSPISAPQANS